jgi:peptidoglycan lytic transglycosylase
LPRLPLHSDASRINLVPDPLGKKGSTGGNVMYLKAGKLMVGLPPSLVLTVALWAMIMVSSMSAVSAEDPLALSRQNYKEALDAIGERRWDDFQGLRAQLDDYPLAIYLDYYQLVRQAHSVSPKDAREFMQRSGSTALPNRFLSAYLHSSGKRERWSNFLEVMPEEPNNPVLKCYHFRAQLAAGNDAVAWAGARKLWVQGRSQPDECDPLFKSWEKAGQLTDTVVWERMLAAFDARQKSLLRYVASKGSEDLRPWSDILLKVYASPERLIKIKLPENEKRSADIATHGLRYLARYSASRALQTWQRLQSQQQFTEEQGRAVEAEIALRALFAERDPEEGWLDDVLPRLQDDKLTGIRLRWALSERDWDMLERTLTYLTPEAGQETVWRYWQAVALELRGEIEEFRSLLQALAQERDYYGFLAADRLQLPYSFQEKPLVLRASVQEQDIGTLDIIEELYFHDEPILAHQEWLKVLGSKPDQHHDLAKMAYDRGWYRMAIDAATQAKAWDALDVRFPLAYEEVFDFHAAAQNVPATELLAISRRESAFFPWARSSVGARGLMQVMPATGKQVAASINTSHASRNLYEIEHNVLLGSTYYRQLLDQFSENRIFALSAYNAGPHRVERWRKSSDEALSVDLWVETIPFRETRNYVQAVLAYNVVFQFKRGDEVQRLLTPQEVQAGY